MELDLAGKGIDKSLDAPLTRATSLYERLKADILSARLEPGRKLQLRFLTEHYDAGQTPLREALNRLASEELVIGKEQRGFYVKPISLEELSELNKTRCWVEGLALAESIANATAEWEEALLIAHHRLDRTPRSLSAERFEDNPLWEVHHRHFHETLIGNCASKPLIGFCRQLAERLYRYRALSIRKAFRVRKVGDEHALIFKAALEHKSQEAVELLQAHYRRTAEIIQADLAEQQPA
ncbi:GntR family transcriptional regulator [Allorhizobium sp. BGMRC 0089]|uniref:GntR family transcriptional regulator n=1 Tax=Allorhizobium sonneratiae TaxID=2934936 RepID=UPI00203440B9|nr:GntR family transcriptional regulator [Allorhizobium sonneratiae]MCM2292723.1 GntR family transcriptional regulator [Allorhizobium sonneratiae]